MKIYVLVHSINESMSPLLETSYFLNEEDGKKAFNIRYSNVGDARETIYLELLDTDSMTTERKMMFEGNEEEDDESDE